MSENSNNTETHVETPNGQPPAGWYPDPQNPESGKRYWDGAAWTEHASVRDASGALVHPPVPPAAEASEAGAVAVSTKRGLSSLRWWQWGLIALGALVLSSIISTAISGSGSADDASAERPVAVAEEDEAEELVDEEPEDTTVVVPDVVGTPVAEARVAVEAAGFVFVVDAGVGEDWVILSQGPIGSLGAEPGTEVTVAAGAPKPVYTLAQQNAIRKAQSYLELTGFSRAGLIGQLEYEGFSTEEATFGADNAGADWNAEAAEKAASYLELSSFSRQSLYDQLAYEEFTDAEIQFALAAVGY
ncbi:MULTISPECIES: Ltp family lipoprotein [unclassified Microbacterium]|uniref:Ltp family lipoprotein n=1 Tax=unclassified Microbacterium TaxID=2609290 RepID=UPI00214B7154|nr:MULTISPECIES: Ltp family lipoprotein [unclassified Microbacterium]MCR2784144.1 Ltp family lipoprotein [Microbacterium sp. zg.B96]WIM15020.1 Ltp family lipoprotein [Microbacterium sp. zg-B96]